MSTLATTYFKLETLETLVTVLKEKKEKGVEITHSINDETNQWGQNVSSYVSQTKEQREAKKDRFFVGNGKVFWTDGKITAAERKDDKPAQPQQAKDASVDPQDDLPF